MNLKLYEKNPWKWLHDMESPFEDFWGQPAKKPVHAFSACDFHEDKDHYLISLDLPGMKKDNIKINYENNVLTVSGTREEEYKEEKHQSRFVERFYGSFSRSFNLPSSINEDKVSAHFSDGVLELFLPKAAKNKGKEFPVLEGKRKLFSKALGAKEKKIS